MYEDYDGKLTIGTELDTKGLEKGIKDSEKKLENFRKQEDKLKDQKVKIEADIELDFNKTKQKVKAIEDKLQIDINALPSGRAGAIRETKLRETAQLRINQLEDEANRKLVERTELLDKVDSQLQGIEKNRKQETAHLLKQQIDLKEIKQEQEEINEEKLREQQLSQYYSDVKDKIDGINKGLKKTIVNVGKWALALFGVRTMFAFIRSSMNTIAQGDKQMKADIDYIKGALAYSLYPLIKLIVEWAKKIVFYIGYIIQKWFNYNIFKDANKYLENANKNANKLVKTMAQFDEMSKLSEQNEGTVKPSFDLTDYTGIEVPEWVKWIADNKDKILEVLGQLATIFTIAVVTGWLANLGRLFTAPFGLLALETTLGSIVAIASSIAIIGYVAYSTWEDIKKLKKELESVRYYGENAIQEIANKMENVEEEQDEINIRLTAGYEALQQSNNWWNKILGLSDEYIKNAISVSNNNQKIIDKEIELYRQGKLNKDQKEQVLQNIKDQVTYNEKLIEKLRQEGKDTSDLEKTTRTLKNTANEVYQEVNNTDDKLYDMSMRGYTASIKFEADDNSLTGSINKFINKLKDKLSKVEFFQNLGKGITKFLGFAKGGIVYNLPKLAKGGILNNPGKGVYVGGAIAGENGKEFYMPLQDEQMLSLVGEAIGKHIVINTTLVNKMNGRILSREIQKIQNDNDFAFNR